MFRVCIVLFLLLFIATSVSSDVYRYTDENGVVCYTDTPFGEKAERIIQEKRSNDKKSDRLDSGMVTGQNYGTYVQRAALKYNIEPELIHALIKTESNGNHRALSRKGAMGLMQLMPSTASDMNVRNPFNPRENIEGGTRYLRYLLEKFNGNLTLALAAYNAGPKTVEKYGSIPPIKETKQYINKIFSLYQGKRNYNTSDLSNQDKPTLIYKVVLEDGTILFTNSSLPNSDKTRF